VVVAGCGARQRPSPKPGVAGSSPATLASYVIRQRVPRSQASKHHQANGRTYVGRAGRQHGVPFLVCPRSVSVRRILAAPDVLDAGGGILSQIAALRSPAEQSRKSSLYVIREFAALVLRGLIPDPDDERLVKLDQRRVGYRL
jgi:hypothetical protein